MENTQIVISLKVRKLDSQITRQPDTQHIANVVHVPLPMYDHLLIPLIEEYRSSPSQVYERVHASLYKEIGRLLLVTIIQILTISCLSWSACKLKHRVWPVAPGLQSSRPSPAHVFDGVYSSMDTSLIMQFLSYNFSGPHHHMFVRKSMQVWTQNLVC